MSSTNYMALAIAVLACVALAIALRWCNEWRIRAELRLEELREYRETECRLIIENKELTLALMPFSGGKATGATQKEYDRASAMFAEHTEGCSPGRCAMDYGMPPSKAVFECSGCKRLCGYCMGVCDDESHLCDDCASRDTYPGAAE